jgi:3'(2'), 5'-bisphosphate nucleotidase
MDELLDTARRAAQQASQAVMQIYQREFTVEEKADKTPITEADHAANDAIATTLKETGIPILSEETPDGRDVRRASERVWIVDPLDGTKDFVDRTGDFSIMIALAEQGEPVLGVVAVPANEWIFTGVKGGGAFVYEGESDEPTPIAVSDIDDVTQATVVASRSHYSTSVTTVMDHLGAPGVERVGSNGLKMALIASGRADCFFTPTSKMGEWDVAAPQAVAEAAGARVTDIFGKPLTYNKEEPTVPAGVACTNGHLHDMLITALEETGVQPT